MAELVSAGGLKRGLFHPYPYLPPPIKSANYICFTRQIRYVPVIAVYGAFTTKRQTVSFIWSRAVGIYRNLIFGTLFLYLMVTVGYPRVRNCGTICPVCSCMRPHGLARSNPVFSHEPLQVLSVPCRPGSVGRFSVLRSG